MKISGRLLGMTGWSVSITVPSREKCVICVAPHTSNWDFILGLLAYNSISRKASFLMKSFWFFFPLGLLMRKLGGIPVYRGRSTSLTETLVSDFKNQTHLNLAITPEGTRRATTAWHSGFLRIAYEADVPVQLGIIDYKNKIVIIRDEYIPTGDIDADMSYIKNYYLSYRDVAKYPEKFSTD